MAFQMYWHDFVCCMVQNYLSIPPIVWFDLKIERNVNINIQLKNFLLKFFEKFWIFKNRFLAYIGITNDYAKIDYINWKIWTLIKKKTQWHAHIDQICWYVLKKESLSKHMMQFWNLFCNLHVCIERSQRLLFRSIRPTNYVHL